MFALFERLVLTRRYWGSNMIGCDAVANRTSRVEVWQMEKEKGEAVQLNWMLAVRNNRRYSPLGRGNTDSGTSYRDEVSVIHECMSTVH